MSLLTKDGQNVGWTGGATKKVAITASDSTTFDPPLRALRCTTGGTVQLVLADDPADNSVHDDRTMNAGDEITHLCIKRVLAASTGAYVGYQ